MINDKLGHSIAGTAAAVACTLLATVVALATESNFDLLWIFPPMGAGLAGAVKEFCDWQDNRLLGKVHEVSFLDFMATLAPGLLIGVLVGAVTVP